MKHNEIGPELICEVWEPKCGLHGFLVVDNTTLGPAGGGTRMAPDLVVEEIADLARGMTFKFAIMGLPRGGSKAGIVGNPRLPPEEKIELLHAFGRKIALLLRENEVSIGPDMGIDAGDVSEIYLGAGRKNPRSGLFQMVIEGDPAAFHFTGYGVATAATVAASAAGIPVEECRVIIEGFGQVGVGTARYLSRAGAKVVAISTLSGAIHDPQGLDVETLIHLRRKHGDACVLHYEKGKPLKSIDIYYLSAEVLIPGARPYVINAENAQRLNCRIVCPAANIAVTDLGQIELHRRGIVYVPDYIANAGGALASWVDFLGGNFEQGMSAVNRNIGAVCDRVIRRALELKTPAGIIAEQIVLQTLREAPQKRLSFEETQTKIRSLLGL